MRYGVSALFLLKACTDLVVADRHQELALVYRESEATVNALAWVDLSQVDPKMNLPTPGDLMDFEFKTESRDNPFDSLLSGAKDRLAENEVNRVWYYLHDSGFGAGVLKILVSCKEPAAVEDVLSDHFRQQRYRLLEAEVKQHDECVTVRFGVLRFPVIPARQGGRPAWDRVLKSKHCPLSGHGYVNFSVSTLWMRSSALSVGTKSRNKISEIVRTAESLLMIRDKSALPKAILFCEDTGAAENNAVVLRELAETAGVADQLSIQNEDTEVLVQPVDSKGETALVSASRILRRELGFRLP